MAKQEKKPNKRKPYKPKPSGITPDDIYGPDLVAEAIKKHGLTPDLLIRRLKGELEAKETKFFSDKGEVTDEREVEAWSIQQRARDDAMKLLRMYPAEKKVLEGPTGEPLTFVMNLGGIIGQDEKKPEDA